MEIEKTTVSQEDEVVITYSSENLWKDLGRPDAEEHFAKVKLVSQIVDVLEERKLSIRKLAKVLEVDHGRLSELLRGHVKGYSLDRLIGYLNRLDRSVEISVRLKSQQEEKAGITVRVVDEVVAKAS